LGGVATLQDFPNSHGVLYTTTGFKTRVVRTVHPSKASSFLRSQTVENKGFPSLLGRLVNHSEPMTDDNVAANADVRFTPAEPSDYADVVGHQLAAGMVGRRQLWPRSSMVLPSEIGFFKPESTLYLETFKKDRRNAKELEYVHSAGCWVEQSLAALSLLKDERNPDKQGKLLWLLEEGLQGTKEVLAMRTAHFQTVLSKGQTQANQLADLVETRVEAKRHQIPSEAYADVYAELSAKYVIEAAKSLAKDATGGSKKSGGQE